MAEEKDKEEIKAALILPPCCCLLLNIEFTVGVEPDVQSYVTQLLLEPEFNEQGECFYTINLPITPPPPSPFVLSWGIVKKTEGWAISINNEDLYVFESEYVCPISTLEDWESLQGEDPIFEITSLFISPVSCEDPEIDVPDIIVPDPNCDEPYACRFTNLLKKQKYALSVDIASNSKNQVFGLKGCEENWNNLFMRHLIIDALKCIPQGVYSEATENCLINKLTENCNC